VIGVDLRGAEIEADLATQGGRRAVVESVAGVGPLGGVATFAGVSGFGGRSGSLVVSINFFGTVEVLDALRPQLSLVGGAAVAISSNSATTAPGISPELVDACLEGDEDRSRSLADAIGGPGAYAASKLALARWVRRRAPRPEWAGAGISLNAIAPGHVETALTEEMLADPETRSIIERTPLPMGAPAAPEEIAAVAGLLLGDDGRFFCGSVLFVDGGTDAHFRADDYPTARQRRR
jgi:NAD(P)-dependent dehydrogenase (short-subunit alcohol dehydrogenase family)